MLNWKELRKFARAFFFNFFFLKFEMSIFWKENERLEREQNFAINLLRTQERTNERTE